MLIEATADVNATSTPSRKTPLMVASAGGHRVAVSLLLDAKAAVEARSVDGSTALMLAIESLQVGTVQLLLLHKADAKAQRDDGETPYTMINRLDEKSGMDSMKKVTSLLKDLLVNDTSGTKSFQHYDVNGKYSQRLRSGRLSYQGTGSRSDSPTSRIDSPFPEEQNMQKQKPFPEERNIQKQKSFPEERNMQKQKAFPEEQNMQKQKKQTPSTSSRGTSILSRLPFRAMRNSANG
mmetsp:Transcript_70373/g.116857  ORF Transcript_70373/g.116857 Transcript_70373/m.116857 type:complete len:236 (+) Transcript_70373:140-847(+)